MKKFVFQKTASGELVLNSPKVLYLVNIIGRGAEMDFYWTEDLNEAMLFYEDDQDLKEVRKRLRNSKKGEAPVFTYEVIEAKVVLV